VCWWWDRLPQLAQLVKHDAALRLVLRHIDATLDPGDIVRIARLSAAGFPRGLRNLCKDLSQAAVGALREALAN
jgi:hypothetical protein